jgi:hypothetical protein
MSLKRSLKPKNFEAREDIITDQVRPLWFIDFDWYQQSNRSFSALVQDYLCPKCRERLKANGAEISADELLTTIRDCCSKAPGFITYQLPILESVFRLFLANGNQPLDLEELGKQLSERLGGDTYRTSAEMLSRLLSHDLYYGLRQVKD